MFAILLTYEYLADASKYFFGAIGQVSLIPMHSTSNFKEAPLALDEQKERA